MFRFENLEPFDLFAGLLPQHVFLRFWQDQVRLQGFDSGRKFPAIRFPLGGEILALLGFYWSTTVND